MAVDEGIVSEGVDEVGGDEGEGDGDGDVFGLEITAEGEVGEQGQGSPIERGEEGAHGADEFDADAEANHQERPEGNDHHEQRGECGGEDESVDEGVAGVGGIAAAVGLGDEGVHAEEETAAEDGDHVIEALAESGGTDGDGAVGEAADHESVDHTHAHPTELGEDERQRETERLAKFAGEWAQGRAGHGSLSYTGL